MKCLLDDSLRRLRGGEPVAGAVDPLINELHTARSSLTQNEWKNWIASEVQPHPLVEALREDPFVRHSATRPRGYPGDAELLDYIYGSTNVRQMVNQASDLGRRLYSYSYTTEAPVAVRNRRSLAAAEIDRLASSGARPHILSVACGHLREAQCLQALPAGRIGRFAALDQDPRSLELVRREWSFCGVETLDYSAMQLIRAGRHLLGQFDFIYALGLYDYLSDETGARLAATLVEMLNPGGKLWIANFVDPIWAAGYMEAVMDWWLIYRTPEQLESLAAPIDRSKIKSPRVFVEPAGNVAFLELVRQ